MCLRVRTTGDDFGLPRAGRARRPGDAARGRRPHVGAQGGGALAGASPISTASRWPRAWAGCRTGAGATAAGDTSQALATSSARRGADGVTVDLPHVGGDVKMNDIVGNVRAL